MNIIRALAADEGICCFVGAGGKKTSMYTLADRLDRAVVTATVRIPIFDAHVGEVIVTEDPEAVLAESHEWPLGIVPAREGDDRYQGFDPAVIDQIGKMTSAPVLVKADGARMRRFKAPGDHEPRIPKTADTVIPVVSAHVVGQPLDESLVHRVGRVSAIADVSPGSEITPAIVANVLISHDGGRKHIPADAACIPLVNMIDSKDDLAAGRAIAREILSHSDIPRVVLASMQSSEPLIDIMESPSRF